MEEDQKEAGGPVMHWVPGLSLWQAAAISRAVSSGYVDRFKRLMFAAVVSIAIGGCGSKDPGPLAGTWRVKGPIPMIIQFSEGEVEAMGAVDKVSYQRSGNDVIVMFDSGIWKGSPMRFSMSGPNRAYSDLGTLTRIK